MVNLENLVNQKSEGTIPYFYSNFSLTFISKCSNFLEGINNTKAKMTTYLHTHKEKETGALRHTRLINCQNFLGNAYQFIREIREAVDNNLTAYNKAIVNEHAKIAVKNLSSEIDPPTKEYEFIKLKYQAFINKLQACIITLEQEEHPAYQKLCLEINNNIQSLINEIKTAIKKDFKELEALTNLSKLEDNPLSPIIKEWIITIIDAQCRELIDLIEKFIAQFPPELFNSIFTSNFRKAQSAIDKDKPIEEYKKLRAQYKSTIRHAAVNLLNGSIDNEFSEMEFLRDFLLEASKFKDLFDDIEKKLNVPQGLFLYHDDTEKTLFKNYWLQVWFTKNPYDKLSYEEVTKRKDMSFVLLNLDNLTIIKSALKYNHEAFNTPNIIKFYTTTLVDTLPSLECKDLNTWKFLGQLVILYKHINLLRQSINKSQAQDTQQFINDINTHFVTLFTYASAFRNLWQRSNDTLPINFIKTNDGKALTESPKAESDLLSSSDQHVPETELQISENSLETLVVYSGSTENLEKAYSELVTCINHLNGLCLEFQQKVPFKNPIEKRSYSKESKEEADKKHFSFKNFFITSTRKLDLGQDQQFLSNKTVKSSRSQTF